MEEENTPEPSASNASEGSPKEAEGANGKAPERDSEGVSGESSPPSEQEEVEMDVEEIRESVRTIAVLGEMRFLGKAVVAALRDAGFAVRALVPDDEAELALRVQDTPASDAIEGVQPPPLPELTTVRGLVKRVEDVEQLCKGASGLAILSPVGVDGRTWDAQGHLEHFQIALSVAESQKLEQILYLSTLAAESRSGATCIQHALQIEEQLAKTPLRCHAFRVGPVMGRDDGFLSRIADRAAEAWPFLLLWGYGDLMMQPIHVEDLAVCVVRAFQTQPEPLRAGIYSLAGKETVTLLELLDRSLERLGRFKLKFHLPHFILKLLAAPAGESRFRERVELLSTSFVANHNDAPKILGPGYVQKTVAQAGNEVMGVR